MLEIGLLREPSVEGFKHCAKFHSRHHPPNQTLLMLNLLHHLHQPAKGNTEKHVFHPMTRLDENSISSRMLYPNFKSLRREPVAFDTSGQVHDFKNTQKLLQVLIPLSRLFFYPKA